MKPVCLAISAILCSAGGAHAQLLERPAAPALESTAPMPLDKLRPATGWYAGSEGLPPADPKAPDWWRAEPKLFAGIELAPHLGIEATFTNPGYRQGLRYQGHGPRLAEGVALGAKGYNFDVAGRASVAVNDSLSAFGTLGVAADVRKYPGVKAVDAGPTGSVGATYKLNSKQTATAEIPLGAGVKRISGARGGFGGTVKLGF